MSHAYVIEPQTDPQVVVLNVSHHSMKNFNYVVVDPLTLDAVVVDPAWEMGKIDQALADANARLRGILVTHAHPDHIHLSRPLARKYGCPIWMSKAEIEASRFDADGLVGIDERPIAVGEMQVEPIVTPGHTPGSTCFLVGENLFTGDVLFAEGCGMCPDVESAHQMFASLQHLKTRLSPDMRVYPGHSYGHPPGRTMAEVRRENLYLQFTDRDAFTAFRLRSGQKKARMFSFV